MKRLFGLALLGLCLAVPASAQNTPSPETMRAAQDLAALVSKDTVQQLTSAIFNQMWSTLEGQMSSKVDAATLAELRSEVERVVVKFASEAVKDAPTIYARHFTVAEMGDILAFYKTPTGAKALREMPKVAAESAALMAPRMAPFQQEIGASIQAIMKKHGYDK